MVPVGKLSSLGCVRFVFLMQHGKPLRPHTVRQAMRTDLAGRTGDAADALQPPFINPVGAADAQAVVQHRFADAVDDLGLRNEPLAYDVNRGLVGDEQRSRQMIGFGLIPPSRARSPFSVSGGVHLWPRKQWASS